jgi:hypothetical protein
MNSEAAFIIVIFLCAVMFAGTPDLHDALVSHAMNRCSP